MINISFLSISRISVNIKIVVKSKIIKVLIETRADIIKNIYDKVNSTNTNKIVINKRLKREIDIKTSNL